MFVPCWFVCDTLSASSKTKASWLAYFAPQVISSRQVKPSQVKSGQVTSSQVKSGQVTSSQVKSNQPKSSQTKSSQAKLIKINSSQVKSSPAIPQPYLSDVWE